MIHKRETKEITWHVWKKFGMQIFNIMNILQFF